MTNITSALDKAHIYNDLTGLHELRSARGTEAEKVQATAKQFESMMLNLMLKTMRKANEVFAEGNLLNTNSTRFYEDMLDQQLSLNMTRNEGLGLAEMLAKQLTRDHAASPSTGYHTLADYPRHGVLLKAVPLADARPLSAQEKGILAEVDNLAADLYRDGAGLMSTSPDSTATQQAPILTPADDLTTTPLFSTKVIADEKSIYAAYEALAADEGNNESMLSITQPKIFSSPRQFTETLFPAAQRVAAELGVDPKLLLAQAALETGWGKHMITEQGQPSFNLFGIKADSRWQGEVAKVMTTEYRQGVKLKEQAEFRAYSSYQESFRDYLQFLQTNARYQNALAKHAEPKAFAQALQSAGYATDPQYAEKILRIYQRMEDYPGVKDPVSNGRLLPATAQDERG